MTHRKDHFEMRGSRASSWIREFRKDSGIETRESNVVHDIVRYEAGPVRLPLRNGGGNCSRVAEDVVEAAVALHIEDIGEKGVVL